MKNPTINIKNLFLLVKRWVLFAFDCQELKNESVKSSIDINSFFHVNSSIQKPNKTSIP